MADSFRSPQFAFRWLLRAEIEPRAELHLTRLDSARGDDRRLERASQGGDEARFRPRDLRPAGRHVRLYTRRCFAVASIPELRRTNPVELIAMYLVPEALSQRRRSRMFLCGSLTPPHSWRLPPRQPRLALLSPDHSEADLHRRIKHNRHRAHAARGLGLIVRSNTRRLAPTNPRLVS